MSNIDKYYCIYKMNGIYNCVDTNLKTIDNINYHMPYDSNINRFDNYTLKKPNNYNISIQEDFINQSNTDTTNDNYPHTEFEQIEQFDQNIDKTKIKEKWNNIIKILQ